ncbi:TRAP transporter large permease [uncultured Alsobacter sp.]|uniref:TRAP transporter large permease n=1 Tax=uncultured Alsobacter sp. TaxID=1748258 RepID=UPI0025D131D7|nr:TRAP transporter large permease [uncultured Alsobacter sp.]
MIAFYTAGLVGLIVVGVPIAITLIGLGVIGVWWAGIPINIIAQRMVFGLDSFTLLAIPLFLLMGNLMNATGVTERIFRFASAMVGHWRAGLAHVNVIASGFFAGMSGSAIADAAGLGAVQIRAMRQQGYPADYAAAITAASATMAPVIPPSIAAVLYAYIADVSVGRMFMAGVIPGLLMGGALMATIHVMARGKPYPIAPKASGPARRKAFLDALPALVCPFFLIGGMYSGFFTPTEGSAFGVLYAVLLGMVYRRGVNMGVVAEALRETVITTGAVMIIISGAHVFAWILTQQRVPQELTQLVLSMGLNKYTFLLVINVVLLILGMLLDTTAIMLLVTPVIVPAVKALEIDLIHFGMVMIVNMMIGLLTPPVGMALFVVSNLSGESVEKVAKASLPYVVSLTAVLLLITYAPALVLALPDLVYGAAK